MSFRGGLGSRGKGKRRFAPQGNWRQSSGDQQYYNEEKFPILQRPHNVPFPTASPSEPPAHKSKKKDEYFLVEKASQFWGPGSNNVYNEQLISGIFENLRHSKFSLRQVMALEYSQYLENYLWRHFTSERATPAYLLCICLMVNQKWRQGVPPWQTFVDHPTHFPSFTQAIMDAATSSVEDEKYSMKEHTILLIFLDHTFNSLEVDVVREQVQKWCSLPIWESLPQERLEKEFAAVPKLKKYWNVIHKRDKALDEEGMQRVKKERSFLWDLMQRFLKVLPGIPAEGSVDEDAVSYCERFLELVTDLQAQLHTRRFFNTLMQASHLLVKCSLSPLASREPEGHLFKQLLIRLQFYAGFEINDHTGSALTDHEMMEIHYQKITSVQRAAFKLFPELRSFSLSTVCGVDKRSSLMKHFSELPAERLHAIARYLHLVAENDPQLSKPLLLEVLVAEHERRQSQLEAMNSMPLYPTEEILWDINQVPAEFYSGETCLALPKLNLQFLTLHDYLLRNFELFRLESTYEIREDIEDAVSRLKPWGNTEGGTEFSGWARMAIPVATFSVVEVGAPHVGEDHPSRVRADVTVELVMSDTVKKEWEGLRKHDVCFLISVEAKMGYQEQFDWSKPFVTQVGLKYVRGCEIEGMLDENGHVIEEGPEPKPQFSTNSRTFRVWLDTNQYQKDMTKMVDGAEDVYESFNIFMRRKPKENNFKAVLETIRDLMNAKCVVPDWLHDVFLGYGDPGAAHYKAMPPTFIQRLDFNDTFLSYQHLVDSFPDYDVQCDEDEDMRVPPFIIEFPPMRVMSKKRKRKTEEAGEEKMEEKPVLEVTPYRIPNRGPYPYNQPKKNAVPFTPTQVEAIVSGMQPGLTLVVGPPGTGKTDVAVQIISNIYHNFPNQRTLLVTHSNQALNQLFEKIMALDIDERHLLRLGHGEEELSTEKDFSRYGRVNFILALRLDLLKEVERLQASIGVTGDVSYTCETASYFFLYQVAPLWDKYYGQIKTMADQVDGIYKIAELFPFTKYFSTAPQPLFKGNSFSEDLEIAEGCYRHLKKIFKQLERFRPFELLRTGRKRIDYLMACEAKIVAMTCTHAALKRRDMVDLAFKYDNVLMEEAAQILEVETFIPLMLQNPQDGHNRLKRVVMIGDHHQLPPVIKNMSFQKYSNMEQSLFTRFVRLGVPVVQLDGQGRARPSLCSLYKWRYKKLGDLPHVLNMEEYRLANAGMLYDYQLIDVQDFNGVGETEPTPHFIQNLAEAEYAVALFMYLRLQGYPPDKIAILTTYNGQKHLIRDVLARRCGKNPVFGLPEKVTTVDRYQGQQNDFIILSLVRTKHIGHLRDVRRLVVALSRARLGLYILARVGLFQSCTELQPAFQLLLQRPSQLHLIPDDYYPTARKVQEGVAGGRIFVVAGMAQLADYVYRDYQVRINALQANVAQRQRLEAPPTLSAGQMSTSGSEQETADMRSNEESMDTSGPQDSGPHDMRSNEESMDSSGPQDSSPQDSSPHDMRSNEESMDSSGPQDSSPQDSGPQDSGPQDSGPPDSGPPDSGPPDSGPPDSGPQDSGPPDSGPPDSGPQDSGPQVSGPPDSGPPDSGPQDSGPQDSSPQDSGPQDITTNT